MVGRQDVLFAKLEGGSGSSGPDAGGGAGPSSKIFVETGKPKPRARRPETGEKPKVGSSQTGKPQPEDTLGEGKKPRARGSEEGGKQPPAKGSVEIENPPQVGSAEAPWSEVRGSAGAGGSLKVASGGELLLFPAKGSSGLSTLAGASKGGRGGRGKLVPPGTPISPWKKVV